MQLKRTTTNLRILDFDIETRPLSYWGDRPTAEITVIASCWTTDLGSMQVNLLGVEEGINLLKEFVVRYNQADIVTGHNIRRFDLPQINGALMEYGLPKLGSKLTVDTYGDIYKRGDIPASQEYLLDLFGLGTKVHMGQHAWREANRLLPEGIRKAYDRCAGDVVDHMRLRPYMLQRGLLKAPRIWRP